MTRDDCISLFHSAAAHLSSTIQNNRREDGLYHAYNLMRFDDSSVEVDAVNDAMRAAAEKNPGIIGVVEDPIVSSDVIGSSLSLLFDAKGTIKAGANTIKTLSWYENLGHAARLLDVVRLYNTLDQQREAA